MEPRPHPAERDWFLCTAEIKSNARCEFKVTSVWKLKNRTADCDCGIRIWIGKFGVMSVMISSRTAGEFWVWRFDIQISIRDCSLQSASDLRIFYSFKWIDGIDGYRVIRIELYFPLCFSTKFVFMKKIKFFRIKISVKRIRNLYRRAFLSFLLYIEDGEKSNDAIDWNKNRQFSFSKWDNSTRGENDDRRHEISSTRPQESPTRARNGIGGRFNLR